MLPLLIGLTVLVVTGVLPDSVLGLPFAAYGLLQATVYYLRKHRINSKYRTAKSWILTIVFPAFVLVLGFCVYRRDRQIKGALEAQRELAAGTAA